MRSLGKLEFIPVFVGELFREETVAVVWIPTTWCFFLASRLLMSFIELFHKLLAEHFPSVTTSYETNENGLERDQSSHHQYPRVYLWQCYRHVLDFYHLIFVIIKSEL